MMKSRGISDARSGRSGVGKFPVGHGRHRSKQNGDQGEREGDGADDAPHAGAGDLPVFPRLEHDEDEESNEHHRQDQEDGNFPCEHIVLDLVVRRFRDRPPSGIRDERRMVEAQGIEPWTRGLRVRCSAS